MRPTPTRPLIALCAVLLCIAGQAAALTVTVDAPETTVLSYFDITLTWEHDQSTADIPYLDVSFPDGVESVTILDAHDFTSTEIYAPGDCCIYHRDGSQVSAEDFLVTAWRDEGYSAYDLQLEIRVYPNISGPVPFRYRGTLTDGETYVLDPEDFGGCELDQQGWWAYCGEVMSAPTILPDLTALSLVVNDGDQVETGVAVPIEVVVAEIGGMAAGSVDVEYRVNGTAVGTDATSSLGALETDSEEMSYTFSSAGTYTVSAVVDPDEAIIETDETNNSISVSVSVVTSPHLAVDPSDELVLEDVPVGYAYTDYYAIRIYNSGAGTLDWELDESIPWATFSATSGSISSGSKWLNVTVDSAGMEIGQYTGEAVFSRADGGESVTLSIVMNCLPYYTWEFDETECLGVYFEGEGEEGVFPYAVGLTVTNDFGLSNAGLSVTGQSDYHKTSGAKATITDADGHALLESEVPYWWFMEGGEGLPATVLSDTYPVIDPDKTRCAYALIDVQTLYPTGSGTLFLDDKIYLKATGEVPMGSDIQECLYWEGSWDGGETWKELTEGNEWLVQGSLTDEFYLKAVADCNGAYGEDITGPYTITGSDWPEDEPARYAFHVSTVEEATGVGRVRFLFDNVCYDVEVENDFAVVPEEMIARIPDGDLDPLSGAILYDLEGERLGEIDLEIPEDPYRSFDAWLRAHDDEVGRAMNCVEEWPGWEYYEPGDVPITVLVPPYECVQAIEPDYCKPVVFAHGLNSNYFVWGEIVYLVNWAYYDGWRVSYPKDQHVTDNGILLHRLIAQVAGEEPLYGARTYAEPDVAVITHSMGGLVTRSMLDQFGAGPVEKVLMIAPPSRGSYSANRAANGELVTELIDLFGRHDGDAPAYRDLSLGSDFNMDLPENELPALGTGEVDQDYMMILGRKDIAWLPHEEMDGQDDGVVSFSSALLLDAGVPTAVVDAQHLAIHSEEGIEDLILPFLAGDDEFEPMKYVEDECWLYGPEDLEDPECLAELGVNVDAGGLLLVGTGDYESDELGVRPGGAGTQGTLIPYMLDIYPENQWNHEGRFERAPGTDRFIYLGDGVGTAFEGDGPGLYTLRFLRYAICANGAGDMTGGWSPCGTASTTLYFEPMYINETALDLTGASTLAFNTDQFEVLTIANRGDQYGFTVDEDMDVVIFTLADTEGALAEGHDFVIMDPEGRTYSAGDYRDATYLEDLSAGFAQFVVSDPLAGEWFLEHRAAVTAPRVTASYSAGVSIALDVAAREEEDGGGLLLTAVVDGVVEGQRLTLNAHHSGVTGGDLSALGELSLTESRAGTYTALLTDPEAGDYAFALDLTGTLDGEAVTRHVEAFLSLDELDPVANEDEDEPIETELPSRTELTRAWPNPFNPQIHVEFALESPGRVSLEIYDLSGALVRTLVSGNRAAGVHDQVWDGRDDAGKASAAGVYLVNLRTETVQQTGKIVLVR